MRKWSTACAPNIGDVYGQPPVGHIQVKINLEMLVAFLNEVRATLSSSGPFRLETIELGRGWVDEQN